MNPIILNITHQQLVALIYGFDLHQWGSELTPDQKSSKAICDELYNKFYKKEIDKRGVKTEFKISLKYYQGYALQIFCLGAFHSFKHHSYEQNLMRILINKIREQL